MVWAIAIVCISLSCEPVPQVAGWFFSESDCDAAIQTILESWKPEIGHYGLSCFPRFVI